MPTNGRFDGAAWFRKQMLNRTRAALNEKGSKAKPGSNEYQAEYDRQLSIYRAERAEVKKRKAEKYAARMAEQKRKREEFIKSQQS